MRYWNEIIIDVKASKLRLSLSLVYIALIVIFLGKKSRSIPRMVGEILVWYFAMQGITALSTSSSGTFATTCSRRAKSFEKFVTAVDDDIDYHNNRRIQKKTNRMPPVQYRIASSCGAS